MDVLAASSVPPSAASVVFVEGMSDRRALETLAERRGRDLEAEGVAVVSMGGSKNIRRFMETYGPQGRDLRLAGLVDEGEEGDFRRAIERAASVPTSPASTWKRSASTSASPT